MIVSIVTIVIAIIIIVVTSTNVVIVVTLKLQPLCYTVWKDLARAWLQTLGPR